MRAIRLEVSRAALVALSVLAFSCSAPGTADGPEETLGSVEEALLDPNDPLCDVGDASVAYGYTLRNNVTNQDEVYADTTNLTWLLNVRAEMQFIAPHDSPFDDTEVFVGKGYAGGHSAIDYLKTTVPAGSDATYPVRAVADGQVVTVTYDNVGLGVGMGNTVVVEHTAPTGKRYRALYAHLRDGDVKDCQAAQTFAATLPPTNAYRLFANSQTCTAAALDDRVWGTSANRILVQPGQFVVQGQLIGWAGNTGMGGIGQALNPDGTIWETTRMNTHLHLYFSVENTDNVVPGAQFIDIDPYGAYATTSSTAPKTNCYLYGAQVQGHRLFAPFNPTFAGVKAAALAFYSDYYPSMGYFPATMSIYPAGTVGQRHAAGSFQPQVRSPETTFKTDRSRTDFLNDLSQQAASGNQLREIQVASFSGDIRYNGIWTRSTSSASNTVLDADDTTWNATLTGEITNNHRHLTDTFTYTMNGIRRHAGIFATDGVPITSFNFASNRSLTNFNTLVTNEAAAGRKPTSVSAEPPGDTTYGGVFHTAQGDWFVEPNITGGPNGFFNRNNFHLSQGRRLYRVQGYALGLRFAAIWVGGERPPSAIITSSGQTACGGPSGASITLDARTSIFDAAFPLGFEWQGPFGTLTGSLRTVNLPVGSNFVQLRAWDGRGLDSLTTAQIDITQDVTAPTLTPPSNRTITTCTNANIGTATATDACGTPTITNNKPAKFPLGNTTVTWTARDAAGNTTTRTQVVTAVLGDSSTCCPANTNVITGSSFGQTLNGTSGSDCILGLGGNDTINGNGGNDYLSGGSGDDTINGGSNTDSCYGGLGNDGFTSCESSQQ